MAKMGFSRNKPQMKKLFLLCSILPLLMSTAVYSADFEKGQLAYKVGDFETAQKELEPLAEKGNATAQSLVGGMYADGQGVEQDYKAAAHWFSRSAEQGNASAQYRLGLMFAQGENVPQSDKFAGAWFRVAAENGAIEAQYALGQFLAKGLGMPLDYVEAYMWFDIASMRGNEEAREQRGKVATNLTSNELEYAKKATQECIAKDYRECATAAPGPIWNFLRACWAFLYGNSVEDFVSNLFIYFLVVPLFLTYVLGLLKAFVVFLFAPPVDHHGKVGSSGSDDGGAADSGFGFNFGFGDGGGDGGGGGGGDGGGD